MARTDLCIKQGKTFSRVLRWSTDVPSYAQISNITNSAPVRITSASHGIPDGWDVCVASARGMREINILDNQPRLTDFKKCSVIDVNTISVPTINSLNFKPYAGGGAIVFMTPVNLSGYTGRFIVKDRIGGTVLHTATPVFDNTAKTITVSISASDTAAFAFSRAVYEFEAEDAGGAVTQLMYGTIVLEKEIAV